MKKHLIFLAVAITLLTACTKAGDEANSENNDPSKPPFEIWMGQKTGSTGSWSNLRWMIVLPDGSYFNQLPAEGFLSFSKNQTGGTWGSFTISNNTGSFTNAYENLSVKKISETEMEIIGYTNHLYKLTPVDGVKLSGKYVNGIPGWSTGGNYPYGTNEAQPMIEFTADGNFTDKGAFVLNFTMPFQYPERAPGRGSYEIKSFTITLNYEDGRKVTKALCGVLNNKVTPASELILVGGHPFYNK